MLSNTPLYLRLIYGAILVLGLFIVWKVWAGYQAAGQMHAAPMGQSTGPEKAAVTLVEFIDYRCSHCRDVHPVIKQVAADHPDIRVVFRHLPSFGLPSIIEAQFALAAGMQGKFNEVNDYLMTRQRPLDEEAIPALAAEEFGLDSERLVADMKSPEIANLLLKNVNAAERLGINATPTFMINKTVIRPQELGRMPDASDFARFIQDAR